MTVLFLFVIFMLMLLVPFVPGIKELARPRDDSPLPINMNYQRDPRYFGKSFTSILQKSLELSGFVKGTQSIRMSKEEIVEVTEKLVLSAGSHVDHVLYVKGNFRAHEGCTLEKEVYAGGKATIGEKSEIRALATEGRIHLGAETKVMRWVDSQNEIFADRECDLGWSVSCEGRLKIGSGCIFRRLYGMPIAICGKSASNYLSGKKEEISDITDTALVADSKWIVIPPGTKIGKTIISKKHLLLKRACVVLGDVKTYGNLVLEDRVRVTGNVFAEGDITVGASARILGNVFSQGAVKIGKMARIGKTGSVKSVVSRRGTVLEVNATIYGYVNSGKRARVL